MGATRSLVMSRKPRNPPLSETHHELATKEELKKQLDKAKQNEEYEKCAVIRDKIEALV